MAACRRTPIPAAGFFVRREFAPPPSFMGRKEQRRYFTLELRFLKEDDHDFVMSLEHRVTEESFRQRIAARNSFVLWEQGERVGLLSYFILWERIPFLNHLILCESRRGKGLGTQAMALWEDFLRENGYRIAVLSTQVDERAQFLYRRLGYVDCGGLVFHGTPVDQPLELFLRKVL